MTLDDEYRDEESPANVEVRETQSGGYRLIIGDPAFTDSSTYVDRPTLIAVAAEIQRVLGGVK